MAHANQERWASCVDVKLRNTLVTRDNLIFNSRYEGDPTSGKVKIPVRDTEVAVKEYDKANGVAADVGTTTYLDLNIDQDEAVNELIDGYDAASVPDGIVADRLDSAGYSLGLSIDKKSIAALEGADGASVCATKTAATGVPAGLLSGASEEDCTAQAQAILEFARPGYPSVRDGGEADARRRERQDDGVMAAFRQLNPKLEV